MKLPSSEEFPIHAPVLEISVDKKLCEAFEKAFQATSANVPPTILARGLEGIFGILNQLEVDWKSLFHATQSFEYHQPLQKGMRLRIECSLNESRKRGGAIWLPFTMKAFQGKDLVAEGKTLIVVGGA